MQGNYEANKRRRAAIRAARMAFKRCLVPATGRRVQRTTQVPHDIAENTKADHARANTNFEAWLNSVRNWVLVHTRNQRMARVHAARRTTRKWLHAAQVLGHVKCETVVSCIISTWRQAASRRRQHAGAPGCSQALEQRFTVNDISEELVYLKPKAAALNAALDKEASNRILDTISWHRLDVGIGHFRIKTGPRVHRELRVGKGQANNTARDST